MSNTLSVDQFNALLKSGPAVPGASGAHPRDRFKIPSATPSLASPKQKTLSVDQFNSMLGVKKVAPAPLAPTPTPGFQVAGRGGPGRNALPEQPVVADGQMSRPQSALNQAAQSGAEAVYSIPQAVPIMRSGGATRLLTAYDRIDRGEDPNAIAYDPQAQSMDMAFAGRLQNYKDAPDGLKKKLRDRENAAIDPRSSSLYSVPQTIIENVQKAHPTNPAYEGEFWASDLPAGLATVASSYVAGPVGRFAKVPGAVVAGGTGMAMQASSTFKAALSKGASIETAARAAAATGLTGWSEAIPVAGWLGRLDRRSGGRITRILTQGVEEFGQEGFQGALTNAIEGAMYDPERGVMEGVPQGAGVGFTVGSIVQMMTELAIPGRQRGASAAAPAETVTTAAPGASGPRPGDPSAPATPISPAAREPVTNPPLVGAQENQVTPGNQPAVPPQVPPVAPTSEGNSFIIEEIDPETGTPVGQRVIPAPSPAAAADAFDSQFPDGSGPLRRASIAPAPQAAPTEALTPPVPSQPVVPQPAQGAIPAAQPGLVVARRSPDGRVQYGKPGDLHVELMTDEEAISGRAQINDQMGFALPDGQFMTRAQTAEWINKNSPNANSVRVTPSIGLEAADAFAALRQPAIPPQQPQPVPVIQPPVEQAGGAPPVTAQAGPAVAANEADPALVSRITALVKARPGGAAIPVGAIAKQTGADPAAVQRALQSIAASGVANVRQTKNPMVFRRAAVQPGPQDIFQFIASQGGIKPDGELEGITGGRRTALYRRLARQNGRGWDQLTGAAIEAGFLPEGAGVNDFRQLVDAQSRGQTARAIHGQDATAAVEADETARTEAGEDQFQNQYGETEAALKAAGIIVPKYAIPRVQAYLEANPEADLDEAATEVAERLAIEEEAELAQITPQETQDVAAQGIPGAGEAPQNEGDADARPAGRQETAPDGDSNLPVDGESSTGPEEGGPDTLKAEQQRPFAPVAPAKPGTTQDETVTAGRWLALREGTADDNARDYLLEAERADGFEHMVVVDSESGALIAASTTGKADEVTTPVSVTRRAISPDGNLRIHHNHPVGVSLSPKDISLLATPGFRQILAHTKAHEFEAELSGELLELVKAHPGQFGAIADFIFATMDSAAHATLPHLKVEYDARRMTMDEGNLMATHIPNVVADRMGLIKYTSQIDDEVIRANPSYVKALRAAAEAIKAKISEYFSPRADGAGRLPGPPGGVKSVAPLSEGADQRAEGGRDGPQPADQGRAQGGQNPRTDRTDQGDQRVIPGAESITDRELIERKSEGPAKAKKPQKDTGDLPLFDDGARKQQTLFQSAYHGSPHSFDRFSTEKIGTGEGAQAYGWGLYFAGKKAVAEYYKKTLADKPVDLIGSYVEYVVKYGRPKGEQSDTRGYLRAQQFPSGDEVVRLVDRAIAGGSVQQDGGFVYTSDAMRAFRQLEEAIGKKGRLYTVDIPEDNELLDWDKPLSEQPEGVKKALESIGIKETKPAPPSDPAIASIIRRALKQADGDDDAKVFDVIGQVELMIDNDQTLYREALAHAARTTGHSDETTMERLGAGGYVVSRARDYLKALTDARQNTGETIYRQWTQKMLGEQPGATKGAMPPKGFDPQRAASEALRAAGIPGLRYLDEGSRGRRAVTIGEGANGRWFITDSMGTKHWYDTEAKARKAFADSLAEEQTHNYVIFDDFRIKTLAAEQNRPFSDSIADKKRAGLVVARKLSDGKVVYGKSSDTHNDLSGEGENGFAFPDGPFMSRKDAWQAVKFAAPSGESGARSKIGQSIETKAIETQLSNGFGDTAGYDPITIRDQAERASKLINSDLEEARAIVRGEKPLPSGLRGTSLITAMEQKLLQKFDPALAHELANSPLVSATSAAAQEMRLMSERVPDSITAQYEKIRAARKAAVEKRGGTKAAVEKTKTEIKRAIRKTASKRPDWATFINEIRCRA